MMQQADNAWSRNDVSAARRLWEYAANKGSGAAARRLGESYDPNVMHSIGGLSPNKDEALRWYQKAESLGDREASSLRTRLAR
jgi:TPR repeat protein